MNQTNKETEFFIFSDIKILKTQNIFIILVNILIICPYFYNNKPGFTTEINKKDPFRGLLSLKIRVFYIIPGIPPIPIPPPIESLSSFSGSSATAASVVRSIAAAEAAF